MPKVTEEHRSSRRREITRAALRLFAKQGFQATSMADIIAESGLSAGAIYGHYKGKDEIIQTAIAEILVGDFSTIGDEEALPPGDLMRRFVEVLEAEMGDLALLVQIWGQAVLEPTARVETDRIGDQLRRLYSAHLAHWYRDGLDMDAAEADRQAARYAPLYLGMMQGSVLQAAIFSAFDRDDYFALANGLRPAFD